MVQLQAREAAFLVLDHYYRQGIFLDDSFEQFKGRLSEKDFALAYEIAAGVVRQQKALNSITKLPKKRQEKILLRMALYQLLFLDRVPAYAIGDEMVSLAKRYTSPVFAKFLNAFIRNQQPKRPVVPSYPDYFIERTYAVYGHDKASEIMQLGNSKSPLFARDRVEMKMVPVDSYDLSNRYYIQNPTQLAIYSHLKQCLKHAPKTILDLAASPGGKTILMHDFFPDAELYANDLSEKKVAKLQQNLAKYGIKATLSIGSGLDFASSTKFDLIIVDAPCSNSGCLYKCPEARWRISAESVQEQALLQKKLIEKALSLLSPHGMIFYSTCSILPEENEKVASTFNVISEITVLPTAAGFEGGYGACISHST